MSPIIIALLTDFGHDDPYVGIMKGIISTISPQTTQIDLTHLIPSGDIHRAAFLLWQSAKDFPKGSIFLAVVDPGVGTERKAICLKCQNQIFFGPDNGLFSYLDIGEKVQAWELTNPEYHLPSPSSTFHGRDIFAPAAAYAAKGILPNQFGPPLATLQTFPKPKLSISRSSIQGEIISHDRFGNLFTSLGIFNFTDNGLTLNSWLNSEQIQIPNINSTNIRIKNYELPLIKTFGEIAQGSCAGIIGSTGLLEIISNQDSAKKILDLQIGDSIIFSW